MRFFTLCIVTLVFFGCRKRDHTTPELSSHWAIPNAALFQFEDTLFIQALANSHDDFGLTQIQFTVQDLNAKVWVQKSISFDKGTAQWEG